MLILWNVVCVKTDGRVTGTWELCGGFSSRVFEKDLIGSGSILMVFDVNHLLDMVVTF